MNPFADFFPRQVTSKGSHSAFQRAGEPKRVRGFLGLLTAGSPSQIYLRFSKLEGFPQDPNHKKNHRKNYKKNMAICGLFMVKMYLDSTFNSFIAFFCFRLV